MLSLSARRPLDNWNYDSIRPGVVGQVGDANLNVQFKSTFPGDYREAPYTAGNGEVRYGSNVRDGDVNSPLTDSQGARVEDGFFGGMRDSQTTQRGWMFQNIKPEDMRDEPVMGSLPQYKWRNQMATIMNASKSGEKFSALPGGYKPGPFDVPRGGNVPGIVTTEGKKIVDRQGNTTWKGSRPQDYGGGYANPEADTPMLRNSRNPPPRGALAI